MATLYISPTGAGRRDGSSWDNAGTLSNLSGLVSKAGPGGEVLLRADQGAYKTTTGINLYSGGLEGREVTIRGVDGAGRPMNAEITGTRAPDWFAGAANGNEVFKLQGGANHLNFENLSFSNVLTAIRVGADVTDVHVRHVVADNVQRFFENYASGNAKTATIDGLVIEDVEVRGFSKGAIRLQYDTNDVVIRNVVGDSERQDKDNFSMGLHLSGTVHDVLIQHTSMLNSHSSVGGYWNGDGFVTEKNVKGVRFENTYAAGSTDAGYDLKSKDTVLVGAIAEDNKRNFRVWSPDTVMIDVVSLDPVKRGGSGDASHLWVGNGASVRVTGGVFADNSVHSQGVDVRQTNARVVLEDVDIFLAAGRAAVTPRGAGSSVVDENGRPPVAQPWTEAAGAPGAPAQAPAPAPLPAPTPLPTVGVAPGGEVTEGTGAGGVLSFTVTRSGDLSRESSVDYAVTGSGPAPVDAADFAPGQSLAGTVRFAAGESSKLVSLRLAGDGAVEGHEGATLALSGAAGATIGARTATATVLNDDIAAPVSGVTRAAREGAVDLSAAADQVATAKPHHETFFVDVAAASGRDAIRNFGASDVLLTSRALHDGNRDGVITFSKANSLAVDGPAGSDAVRFEGGDVSALRLLGKTADGVFAYADADVRPRKAIEGTLGNDRLSGDAGDKALNAFFFDTALDLDLGDDAVFNFGAKDLLVTTTRLDATDGRVRFADGVLDLPGGTGAPGDGAFAGEGGTVRLSGTDGRALAELEYDGSVVRDGVSYHVYSQVGSAASTGQLLL